MTYDEAMDAVKNNTMSPPDRQSRGGRTVARRLAWDNPERLRSGVIYHEVFVREADSGNAVF